MITISTVFAIGGAIVGACGGILAGKRKADVVAIDFAEFVAGVLLGGVLFCGLGYGLGRLIELL